MAEARSPLPDVLLVLNEGLDEILRELKGVTYASPTTLKEHAEDYSHIIPDDMLSSYMKYMELLPPPGSMLTSKENLVLHNLREILNGAFLLFEAKSRRLIDAVEGRISEVGKDRRKRSAAGDPAEKRDSRRVISMVAEAAAAVPMATEYLQDFDVSVLFEKKTAMPITMDEVPLRPAPSQFDEITLDYLDDAEFHKVLTEMEVIAKGTPERLRPFKEAIDEEPNPDALRLGAEQDVPCQAPRPASNIFLDLPDALPDVTSITREEALHDANSIIQEIGPVETVPPVAVPRIVVDSTHSRNGGVLGIRDLMSNLVVQTAETPAIRVEGMARRRSLSVWFLKKDQSRTNAQLTSHCVNKIVERGSTIDWKTQKWMRALRWREDPFSEDVLLREARECVYKYQYYKKYPHNRDTDDPVDAMIQEIEGIEVDDARTPLRADASRMSGISGRTPVRLPEPSPSPRPVIELHGRATEGPGNMELPEELSDPLQVTKLPSPAVPMELSEGRSGSLHLAHPPEIRRPAMDDLTPPELQLDLSHGRPALLPTTPGKEPDTTQRVEGAEVGVSIPELSPSYSSNILNAREVLRREIVKKLRDAFAKDPSVIFTFTDLCPLTSTKFHASQVFYLLIEQWHEGEVNITQDSPKAQHIYIASGKNYSSPTETFLDSSTS